MQPSPQNPASPPTERPASPPPRLLVVDDEPSVRRACVFTLRAEGWRVEAEGDSRGALVRLVDGERFDALVLDYAMPGLNGLEFLRELERERGLEQVPPVIMASAHADGAVAAEALRLGVWDFLAKPLTPEELRRSVRRLLSRGRECAEGAKRACALAHARRRAWSEALAEIDAGARRGEAGALLAGLLAELSGDNGATLRFFHQAHWPMDWRKRGPEVWIELARRLGEA